MNCLYCEQPLMETDYTQIVTIRGIEHEMHDDCGSFMDEDERDEAAESRAELRESLSLREYLGLLTG